MDDTTGDFMTDTETLPGQKICESVLSVPACSSYQQPSNCLEFWMRHNIPTFFESLCTNETNTENCIHTSVARNAVSALIHQCQLEVWTVIKILKQEVDFSYLLESAKALKYSSGRL